MDGAHAARVVRSGALACPAGMAGSVAADNPSAAITTLPLFAIRIRRSLPSEAAPRPRLRCTGRAASALIPVVCRCWP